MRTLNFNDNIFTILVSVKAIARERNKEAAFEILTEKVFKAENFRGAKKLIHDFLNEIE